MEIVYLLLACYVISNQCRLCSSYLNSLGMGPLEFNDSCDRHLKNWRKHNGENKCGMLLGNEKFVMIGLGTCEMNDAS